MEQMLAALTETMTQQQRQQPLPPPPPSAQAEADNNDIMNLTQKFMKMKPPTFLGGMEPLKAETWDRKVSKFQELKQGRTSVAEYEAKFTELARFAPHMVDTNYKKAQKFDGGLDLEVFDRVGVLKLPTYVEVLDRSLMAEATLATMKQSKAPATTTTDWRGKMSGYCFTRGRSHVSKKQNTGSTSSSSQSSGPIPVCSDCGRRHRGVCYRVFGAYFRCGKTGHVVKDCPLGSENTSRPMESSAGFASTAKTIAKANTGKEPLRQGRVFALVPGDVQNTDTVVSDHLAALDSHARESSISVCWGMGYLAIQGFA
ncbi:uncharacterized protein LOC114308919 [Camellia sinensis]|uniref:uncharacterized protein LOC114308919 n=1 Tax=Camellia sinensis TaxID=4442 RepID=UPI0010359B8E|nr:uncharacterized protein LOC114308919 [Camellia sinensis]